MKTLIMIIYGVKNINDQIIDALYDGIHFCWIATKAQFRSFGLSETFDALLTMMLMFIYLFNLRDPIF